MATIDKIVKTETVISTPTPPLDVSLSIVQNIYNTIDMDIILDDNILMHKIVVNGYYKAAFCNHFNIDKCTINLDGIDYPFISLGDNTMNVLELINGDLKTIPIDVNLIP